MSKDQFVQAMMEIQQDRQDEAAGHTWQRHLERYGPRIYFGELAGIISRLERLLWEKEWDALSPRQAQKVLDLLVDLGNYTGFLFEFLEPKVKELIASTPELDPRNFPAG